MQKPSSDYVIKRLLNRDIYYFTPDFLSNFLNLKKEKVYNLLKTLQRKELVERIEKGKYLVVGFEPERILSRPNFIGSRIVTPSYVSFWSALSFYTFTEQVPRRITFVTTKRKDDVTFKGYRFKYIKLKPRRFFGYTKKGDEFGFLMADEEKAIIDSIFLPKYAGGMSEVFKAFKRAVTQLDKEKLIDYAIQMENKSLCARLGFMLKQTDKKGEKLKSHLPKSPVKLDPSKERKGKIDNEWNIYINMGLEG